MQVQENAPGDSRLAPVEKLLWRNLWKSKTSPKIMHFMWRALSGALAVKRQLRLRGIQVDPTCSLCSRDQEIICHVLFNCEVAARVWELVSVLRPTSGFSRMSVFLNLHHLLKCSKNMRLPPQVRLAFPWILWHLWKARNAFCFEQVHLSPDLILARALEEADVWLNLHGVLPAALPSELVTLGQEILWRKPPINMVKCNIGASWLGSHQSSGVAWLLRDHDGNCVAHRVTVDVLIQMWYHLWRMIC